jgi:hypothetical protein
MRVNVKGGTVVLRDRLDFSLGQALRYAVIARSQELREEYGVPDGEGLPDEAIPDLRSAIALHELLRGIESWSFPEPVTRKTIHDLILDNDERSMILASAADGLYQAQVFGPLALLASSSSPPTPTDGSTSPTSESSSASTATSNGSTHSLRLHKPSKRSSTTTTQTVATGTTTSEPVGVSSS